MATITTAQRTNLRLDAGMADDETVFTNAEMSTLWDRLSGAADDAARHEAALGLMYRQLLASAAKFNNYTIAATREEKQQVFKNLQSLYAMYKAALDAALATSVNPIAMSSLRPLERDRDFPRGLNENWSESPLKPPKDF